MKAGFTSEAVRQTFGSELVRIEQSIEGDLRILNKLWNHTKSSHTINGKLWGELLFSNNRNFEVASAKAEGWHIFAGAA
jgi:hypothetical protein